MQYELPHLIDGTKAMSIELWVSLSLDLGCLSHFVKGHSVWRVGAWDNQVRMFFLFIWQCDKRLDQFDHEDVGIQINPSNNNHWYGGPQRAHISLYIRNMCYLYIYRFYVNLIWNVYLFLLNELCLSLSLSLVIISYGRVVAVLRCGDSSSRFGDLFSRFGDLS